MPHLVSLGTIIRLFSCFIMAAILTPIIRSIALRVGAVDNPNARRINKYPMPSMGGLAIYIPFMIGMWFLFRPAIPTAYLMTLTLSSAIVIFTGIIDDIFELKPWQKSIGIVLAAIIFALGSEVRLAFIKVPFIGIIHFGWWAIPLTILWIFAITNAINLIDGLDGLATGLSIISLTTIGITAFFFLPPDSTYVQIAIFLLVASAAGFIPYNFYPAKIYLGDTGALFLGFMLAILSLNGLKNTTVISLITPLLILGVPITDTIYAIVRRSSNHKSILSPDKMHLHHRLLSLGFTHRGAVMLIYALAMIFSFIALLYRYAYGVGLVLLTIGLLIGVEIFVELIGITGENFQPLMYLFKFGGNKAFRDKEIAKRKKRKQDKKKHQK
ncbi:glycosyltransferase family 4 protein [Bavariicoccus seileri]|uniref:glycosyltransferase family 4 protein n=2 Tax=Bavariicoccus seileri TaxID=549685 RepID=UPI003F9644A5